MSLARRAGIALAISGSVLTLAAASVRSYSPGYTYHLKMSTQITEPDGKTKNHVVMSGRAMVSTKGGRIDVDEGARERGALAEKGGYILFDEQAMMIVSPKEKKIMRIGVGDAEQGMGQLAANVPGMRMTVSDVAVNLEKLGAGEPMFGMATTRYRLTQDYKIAVKVAFINRASTEHIVQDFWVADTKLALANPFGRMGTPRIGGTGAFSELMTKTSEATRAMHKGMALKVVTATTSTNNKNEKTQSVSTMEITDFKAGNVDDALLKAPADYAVIDMGEQAKAMAAQLNEIKGAQGAQAAHAGQTAGVAKPDSAQPGINADSIAKAALKNAAKEQVKSKLGGFLRRKD